MTVSPGLQRCYPGNCPTGSKPKVHLSSGCLPVILIIPHHSVVVNLFCTPVSESENADAFAIDAGIKYTLFEIWDMGIAINNLGSRLKYMSESDNLPLCVRIGNSVRLLDNALSLSMDLIKYRYTDFEISLGIEYDLLKMVGFRLGYNSRNSDVDEGLTAGLGFHIKGFSLDYGYVPYGELGNSHRVSIGYRFGTPVTIKKKKAKKEIKQKKTAEEEKILESYKRYRETKKRKKLSSETLLRSVSYRVLRFKGIDLPQNTRWLEKASQAILESKLTSAGFSVSDENYTYIISGTLQFIEQDTLNITLSIYDRDNNLIKRVSKSGKPNTIITLLEALSSDI